MLTSKFEIIRMDNHETLGKFYAKLIDIVNFNFNLDEPIQAIKIFEISLGEKQRKVTIIGESKDVDSLKINEHVGYVQSFEMTPRLDSIDRGIGLNTIKRRVPKF